MHTDARLTLYGGAAIGVALYALGVVTSGVISLTGLGILGATVLIAAAFNQCLPSDPHPSSD